MATDTTILSRSNVVNVLVSAVVKHDDGYLMVREAKSSVKGLWNFPSGKVEWGETPTQAIIREVLEETGYDCKLTAVMNLYYFYWDDMPGLTLRFNFWAETTSAQPHPLADDVLECSTLRVGAIEQLAATHQLRGKATYQQLCDLQAGVRFPLDVIAHLE